MKKFLILLPFLLVHACGCPGLAQTYVEKQEIGTVNFLKNPGFENGNTAWTRGGGCTANGTVPLSGSRNGVCSGTGAALTLFEQSVDFTEYRPYVGTTFKASCPATTISATAQFCGLFNGVETSCIPVKESASLNADGYIEYAVPIQIPSDQSSSFTAGIRLKTTGSGTFGTRVDNCYLGPWKGVVGLVRPESVYSAVVSDANPSVPNQENVDWINGNCPVSSTSTRTCTFVTGLFTQPPNCTATVLGASGTRIAQVTAATTTSTFQITTYTDAGSRAIHSFYVQCQRSSTDYANSQSTVTNVVGLSPKETELSFLSTNTGSVSSENVDHINGNCSVSDISLYTCPFVTNFFGGSSPNCVASVFADPSGVSMSASVVATNTTQLQVRTLSGGNKSAQPFKVICQRQGDDYLNARKAFDNVPFSPMESGTWALTLSSTTNVASSTVRAAHYQRIGDYVFGSMKIELSATAATTTSFRFNLPIPLLVASFADVYKVTGHGVSYNGAMVGNASAVASTSSGLFTYPASTTGGRIFDISFSYSLK